MQPELNMEMKKVISQNELELANTFFISHYKDRPYQQEAISAAYVLLTKLKNTEASTLTQIHREFVELRSYLSEKNDIPAIYSICELFMRYITSKDFDFENFENLKKTFIIRGVEFIDNCIKSQLNIAKLAVHFITDGVTVLVHSYSISVAEILVRAKNASIEYAVFITECATDNSGQKMRDYLEMKNIKVTMIKDSAVGYIIERVDLIIVGAQAITQSGGIINNMGTYQIALIAKSFNIPFYVAAESFKFLKIFPMKQLDVKNEDKYKEHLNRFDFENDSLEGKNGLEAENGIEEEEVFKYPLWDYTPPKFITMVLSDVGSLDPSAITEELLNLYN